MDLPEVAGSFLWRVGDNNACKIFLVNSSDQAASYSDDTPVFHHGPAMWVKPPQGPTLLAKESEVHCCGFEVVSDVEMMSLQIQDPNASGAMMDAAPCTLRELLEEVSQSGAPNCQLWGHDLQSTPGAAARGEEEEVVQVTPKGDPGSMDHGPSWACKAKALGRVPLTAYNLASSVPWKQLAESPALQQAWRLHLDVVGNILIPKKRLWFLKSAMRLPPHMGKRIA